MPTQKKPLTLRQQIYQMNRRIETLERKAQEIHGSLTWSVAALVIMEKGGTPKRMEFVAEAIEKGRHTLKRIPLRHITKPASPR